MVEALWMWYNITNWSEAKCGLVMEEKKRPYFTLGLQNSRPLEEKELYKHSDFLYYTSKRECVA